MSNILTPPESVQPHRCDKPDINRIEDGSFWKCPECSRWWKADRPFPKLFNFYANKWDLVKLTNVKDRLRIRKLLQDQGKNDG